MAVSGHRLSICGNKTYQGIRSPPNLEAHRWGIAWYCGDLKCKERPWYGMDKKSIRKHVETVHSEDVEKAWKKYALLYPKKLDDHL
jgi:hypothetical protein